MALVIAIVLPVVAQSQEQLTPDGFLDLAQGRTLSFANLRTGNIVGVEQFLRRDLSVWADETGRCTYGRIQIRGPLMCFVYEDAPEPDNCWTPFNDEGVLLVLSERTGEVQRISDITDEPVICEGAPSS